MGVRRATTHNYFHFRSHSALVSELPIGWCRVTDLRKQSYGGFTKQKAVGIACWRERKKDFEISTNFRAGDSDIDSDIDSESDSDSERA